MKSSNEEITIVLRFGAAYNTTYHGVIPARDAGICGFQRAATWMTKEISIINISNLALVGKEIIKF